LFQRFRRPRQQGEPVQHIRGNPECASIPERTHEALRQRADWPALGAIPLQLAHQIEGEVRR